jgi:hypothetical protein
VRERAVAGARLRGIAPERPVSDPPQHDPSMTDVREEVARVGIAGWVGESHDHDLWDTPTVLGVLGDDLVLVEIDPSNRERILSELVDRHELGDRSLRIEIVFFGNAGGFFASSLSFLGLWPTSLADVPAEVFIDDHHKATFRRAGDEILISVRHALRPSHGPPRRRLRFGASTYLEAMSVLARESRRLRDDLIAAAQERAPEKVESLARALDALTIAPR